MPANLKRFRSRLLEYVDAAPPIEGASDQAAHIVAKIAALAGRSPNLQVTDDFIQACMEATLALKAAELASEAAEAAKDAAIERQANEADARKYRAEHFESLRDFPRSSDGSGLLPRKRTFDELRQFAGRLRG